MNGVWLFLHLIGVIIWVGGMFFAAHCLRPSLGLLPGEHRAALMAAALGRFFGYALGAIVLIWLSGLMMLAPVGMKAAPTGWHIMISAAVLMTLLFALIRLWFFPRLQRALAAGQLPTAGGALNGIRWLVMVNLALGLIAVAAVSILR